LAINKQILFIIAFISIFTAFSSGQSPDTLGTVCAESRHYYGVTGLTGSNFIWNLPEGGGVIVQGDGSDTLLVQWNYTTGDYLLEVTEVTLTGCTGAPVVGVVSVQAPEVNLGYISEERCEGDSLVLDATGSYMMPVSYLWHNGSTQPTFVANASDSIWVRVTDGLGCVRYDSMEYISHTLPTVSIGEDTLHCDQENLLVINAGDFADYQWSTSTEQNVFGNPFYLETNLEYIDTIQVVVTDFNGCQNSDTMVVYPCNQATMFKDIINTFTPEQQTNNVWNVLKDNKMDQFPDAVLEIFDRWGRLVYRTENVVGEPWDGTSNGRPMPMGAYFYVLDLNFAGFEPVTGTINLVR
jgi:gliding motility-associated-like protein